MLAVFAVTVGLGFTVTVVVLETTQPPAKVAVTV